MLSTSQLGLVAALSAASIWSVASIIFSAAGRHLRPSSVNLLRLLFALILMLATHLIQNGTLLPSVNREQWIALSLSGVLGLGLGDLALFYAFDAVGPRLAMLVAASAPVMAALLAWIFLGEVLSLFSLFGMALTLFGITWVVIERSPSRPNDKPRRLRLGIICGLLAAAGQAIGVLFTKQGMTEGVEIHAQDAALIRMLSASAVMLPLQLLWWRRAPQEPTPKEEETPRMRALWLIAVGSLMGTYLGMSLSLVAARDASLGKAQTILSLPPVLILPLSYYIQKEQISLRAVVGAIIAVAGTAFLFAS